MFPDAQRGFSIIAAIFIIVALAALGVALVKVIGFQHLDAGLDLQGVRAYQAARAGTEWGLYRVLDPDGAPSAVLPDCWAGNATVTLGGSLAGFSVTATCVQDSTTELTRDIRVYTIQTTATLGTPQQASYVARQVTATLSRCKDPANAPTFDC